MRQVRLVSAKMSDVIIVKLNVIGFAIEIRPPRSQKLALLGYCEAGRLGKLSGLVSLGTEHLYGYSLRAPIT